MKKFTLLVLSACFTLINIYSQSTLELTFTSNYDEQNVSLDSIYVKNLSQGEDTTLYWPDTVLVLDYVTSISDNESIRKNSFTVSQNYPNPFSDQTMINIYLPKKEKIEIITYDMLGREVGHYENTLNGGNHTFTYYPGNEKVYLFTVTGEFTSKTIKMLYANSDLSFGGTSKIVYNGSDETMINFKSQKAINNFVFEFGDELRYIGYANTTNEVNGSDVKTDAPQDNELYVLEITEGIPCIELPTITYGGQVYNTVQIGDQCWMKENLNRGIMIPRTSWMSQDGVIEKYCYNDDTANCNIYGGLYQWGELMNYKKLQQGICPLGWHIPSDDEWKSLEMHLGMSQEHADSVGYRGTDEAKKMKSIIGWFNDTGGNNSSGFSALPGGYHNPDGSVWLLGELGYWWTATQSLEEPTRSWVRAMTHFDQVYRYYYGKYCGFSVRCIKD